MIAYYVLINLIGLFVMMLDKYKAIHHQYRIKESLLMFIILAGGMLGSAASMFIFHHKVKKKKFLLMVILSFIAHIGIYILINKLYYV